MLSGPGSFGIDYFEFINWSLSLDVIDTSDEDFKNQLKDWVYNYHKDMEEFIPISMLVAAIDIPPTELTEKFKEEYIEHLSEGITRDVIEDGILSDVYDAENYDYSEITNYVQSRFSELSIVFEEAEVDCVSECCDIDDIIQSNVNSSTYGEQKFENYREQGYGSGSVTDAIDDLFDRS